MARTKTPQVKTSIRLPAPMHQQLLTLDEISVSDHVRLALAAYLATVRPQSAFVNPPEKRNGQK